MSDANGSKDNGSGSGGIGDDNASQQITALFGTASQSVLRYPELSCFLNESESDVVFIIDGQRVPAISKVLGLKSDVFRAMFSGKFKESDEKEIPIEDTNVEAFKAMVLYIYTDRLVLNDDKNVEQICDVLKIADKYQLIRLIGELEDHLKYMVNVDNLVVVSKIAFTLSLKELRTSVETFIINNLDQLMTKTGEELAALNAATNDFCLKTMANSFAITRANYLKAKQYFKDKLPKNGSTKTWLTINGYKYRQQSGRYVNEFQFEDI